MVTRPNMTQISLLVLFCLGSIESMGAKGLSDLVDPTPFDNLLKIHVRHGMVDYKAVLVRRNLLDLYIRNIGKVPPSKIAESTRQAQLAFYINAYNALTWKAILDHYPIEEKIRSGFLAKLRGPANSIRQIPGVWNKTTHRLAGNFMTLDDIENEILRKTFRDPRVHFALVCAAHSCPLLRPEAYRADKIDQQLDDDVRRFAQDPDRVLVEIDARRIGLSKILKWYSGDFAESTIPGFQNRNLSKGLQGVLGLMAPYLPEPQQRFIFKGNYKIYYFDYDWTLNEAMQNEK